MKKYRQNLMSSSSCTCSGYCYQVAKTEEGRSMVEMLGTLAIIGVLSVGGIAGYTYGMNKYYANEILNGVSRRAVIAMAQLAQGKEPNKISFSEFDDEEINGAVFSDEAIETPYDGEFGIGVHGIKESVCRNLIDMTGDEITITKSTNFDAPITVSDCADSDSLAFLFSSSELNRGNEQCSDGFYYDDSTCVEINPCSEGYYYDGSDCVNPCSSEGYYYDGSSCVSVCSDGFYYRNEECVRCSSYGWEWNGSECVTCTDSCDCGKGYWDGSQCMCSGGLVWNWGECHVSCSEGYYHDGSGCVSVCSEGYVYDGSSCVSWY